MKRVYNFSAGPSMLPLPVLEQAQAELLCHGASGMSVMEMSHRSKPYDDIITRAEASLRRILRVPSTHKILFLQGGASLQFSMLPMNLAATGKADYIVAGNFSGLAAKEAGKLIDARVVATSEAQNFSCIPKTSRGDFNPQADYLHITTNNTIFGTRYTQLPDCGDIPLVADQSSNILSEEHPTLDVSKYAMIYAGAQKNIGPAGLTIVIIREDMLERCKPTLPSMLSYAVMAKNDSMFNTPPCYAIYMAGLVFEYIEKTGGVAAVGERNIRKAKKLYDFLDASEYFRAPAAREDRSIMNVTFTTPTPEADDAFVKQASAAGFVSLKGHRLVGGMRASIYNAMPEEGIADLCAFMAEFEAANK